MALKTTYCYQKSLSIPARGITFLKSDPLKFTKVPRCGEKPLTFQVNNRKGVLPRVPYLSMIKHQRCANLLNMQDTETKVIHFSLNKTQKELFLFCKFG